MCGYAFLSYLCAFYWYVLLYCGSVHTYSHHFLSSFYRQPQEHEGRLYCPDEVTGSNKKLCWALNEAPPPNLLIGLLMLWATALKEKEARGAEGVNPSLTFTKKVKICI